MELENDLITDVRIQLLGLKNRWALSTHSNMVGNLMVTLVRLVEVQGYRVIDTSLDLAFQHFL